MPMPGSSTLVVLLILQAGAFATNDLCGTASCQNGGYCEERSGNLSCRCQLPNAGLFCEHHNPCYSSPCQSDGRCLVEISATGTPSFSCTCPSGWTGKLCETADFCSPASLGNNTVQQCSNGGTCVITATGGSVCSCLPGFGGAHCDDALDECVTLNPCQHSGTCYNTPSGYKCQCSELYTGQNCENVYRPCHPSPCINGGSCLITGTITYSCDCPAGYGGIHCQNPLYSSCSGHRCANGGTCFETSNALGYACRCPPSYKGLMCEEDASECLQSPCLNGATCVNTAPGYLCICANGWTGDRCEVNVDDCLPNPCRNGGICHDRVGSYQCECRRGWMGPICHLADHCASSPGRTAPCHPTARCEANPTDGSVLRCRCAPGYAGSDCRQDVDECTSRPSGATLCRTGKCINTVGSYRCACPPGLGGERCEEDIDECLSSPCQNNGTCLDQLGSYRCLCSHGFTGSLCQTDIDECLDIPCQNGAACHNSHGSFSCTCIAGFEGELCAADVDECASSPCHNGGMCIDLVNGYVCRCPPGYTGSNCSIYGNEAGDCPAHACYPSGTASCTRLLSGYQCLCNDGWQGRRCENETPLSTQMLLKRCDTQKPCQNGGQCVTAALTTGWTNSALPYATCQCPRQFTGHHCEAVVSAVRPACRAHSCQNGATCRAESEQSYTCLCFPGTHGVLCQFGQAGHSCQAAARSLGNSAPCGENAVGCHDVPGRGFVCVCKQNWSGSRCETWEGLQISDGLTTTVAFTISPCGDSACFSKAANGLCDIECNTATCSFDGGDCMRTVPWAHCSSRTAGGKRCQDAFNDSTCDVQCNVEACLYDGFDCLKPRKACDPAIESYCKLHYANGHCDRGCYNEECGWDGLDCLQPTASSTVARGELNVVVLVRPQEFLNRSRDFLLAVGRLLRTVVKLKLDAQSQPVVFPWITTDAQGRSLTSSMVTLTLDNSKCSSDGQQECFETAEYAAEFITAALHNGWTPGLKIGNVAGTTGEHPNGPQHDGTAVPAYIYFVVGAFALVIVCVLVGVFVGGRRKRTQGTTWFPDGFAFTNPGAPSKRRCPEGEAEEDAHEAKIADAEYGSEPVAKKHSSSQKSNAEVAVELQDKRTWNARHYDACLKSSALTPPRHDEQLPDPNCRGPSGITPLMLASESAPAESCRSRRSMTSSSGSSSLSNDDLEVLSELIDQGAKVSERDDHGETALHHAARFGRTEEARFLLDKGADPNAKDLTGRTPLHTAVAADAYRVFQTLLRDRRTNLNERAHDGATPMILAARLAVDDMVAELIQNKADVNAADEHGKSALHWAAAVNNVPAATMLLKFGVNSDVQDDQEQTPLHLAAKEGSYEVASMLIGYGASLDIADCQERTPEDLARERHHLRLLALLQQHGGPQAHSGGPCSMVGGNAAHRRLFKKRGHKARMGSMAAHNWWRANAALSGGDRAPAELALSSEESRPLFGCLLALPPDRVGVPVNSLSLTGLDYAGAAYGLVNAGTGGGGGATGIPVNNSFFPQQPPYSSDVSSDRAVQDGGARSQSLFASLTLPGKQPRQGLPNRVTHDWQRQPFSAAPLPTRYPSYRVLGEGQHGPAGGRVTDCQRPSASSATTAQGLSDMTACQWEGQAQISDAAGRTADCYDAEVACATPSPDSGTGWSSDCSVSPSAYAGAGHRLAGASHLRSSTGTVIQNTRLSSLSNSSPQSDWSDCISPIEPAGTRDAADAVFM